MNLRELMIERIFFAVTEDELREQFMLEPDAVGDLSDVDLFELFENVIYYVN